MLRHILGFEDIGQTDSQLRTELARRYTLTSSTTMFAIAGFKSDRALRIDTGGTLRAGVTQSSTLFIGVRFKFDQAAGASPARFLTVMNDIGSQEIQFLLTASGNIQVIGVFGSQIAITTTLNMSAGTWYYLEFKIVRNTGSSGTIDIWRNGTSVLAATGLQTGVSGRTGYNFFTLTNNSSSPALQFSFDDLYALDNTGSVNNTRLGDSIVRGAVAASTIAVNGSDDPGYSQFLSSGGGSSDYTNVDDIPSDDDSTYNSAAGGSTRDIMTLGAISGLTGVSSDNNIIGVQVNASVRHDSTALNFQLFTRSSGTVSAGATQVPASTYNVYREIFETDPATGSAWLYSAYAAAHFGIQT